MSDEIDTKEKEKVVGTRRNVKKRADLDVIGEKRDAAKVKRAPSDVIELGAASPRHAMSTLEKSRPSRRAETSSRSTFYVLVLATLVMIGATLTAFFTMQRYQPSGDNLLSEPAFSESLASWSKSGEIEVDPQSPDGVKLENSDPEGRTFLRRTVDLPPGPILTMLEATVATERVVAGDESWERARIYLARLNEEGEADWTAPHNLFRLRGTQETHKVSQVFPMPASVKKAALGLELNNATGRMEISDLKLYPVKELPGFRQMTLGLMAAWSVLALAAVVMIFKSIASVPVRLALAAMFCLFLVGLFMPAPVRDGLIDALHMPQSGESGIEPDLIGHGVVFMIMALLVRIGRPHDSIWLHFGCWALIAVASEVLQLFTFDRETSIADFLVDGLGFTIGLTIASFLPRLAPRMAPA